MQAAINTQVTMGVRRTGLSSEIGNMPGLPSARSPTR